jgi:F-type H+-transporting ATPase subunit epsilon
VATLTVSLLTPERVLFEGPAERVVVPMHDGEVGILPGHAAMVGRLGAGISRIHHQGQSVRTFVSGGFVQVAANQITILTDDARPPQELDRAEALEALRALLEEPAVGDEAQSEKGRRLQRARDRVRVARAQEG